DIVLYLKADVHTLVSRLVHGRGFDYWESGMDLHLAGNLYDSFQIYQARLIEQFDQMAEEYHFVTLDAARSINALQQDIRRQIQPLLDEDE
ncbi:MAG TPA: hypothetical protein PLV53_09305, partial [Anaerolineaceae bacterium]|nr:hypothetical protein [Anaerolineaceae bacterium]